MPRLSPLGIALACVVATHSTTSIAAPGSIWRCGNSYSDTPCDGGTRLDAPQAQPSAEDRSQRDADTRRDQAAADRMQRERLELESKPRQALVIGPPAAEASGASPSARVAKPEKKKRNARPSRPDEFVATYADPSTQPGDKKKTNKKKKKKR